MTARPQQRFLVKEGGFAVSRLRQVDGGSYSDPLTAAALGIQFDAGDDVHVSYIPKLEVMNNALKMSGSKWPDAWWQGNIGSGTLPINFTELKPHELAWFLAFLFSDVDAASQIGTTGLGYVHKMRWQADSQIRQHFYTACARLGPELSGVMKLLMYGCSNESCDIEFDRGSNFVKLSGTANVPGKYKTNVFREKILGGKQSTSLTLTANGVEGSTAQLRLDSILGVLCDIEGDGTSLEKVNCTAASDATPAVLTIEKPNAKFRKVYTNIDGVLTDHGDGQTAFVCAIGDSDDELIFGSYKRSNHWKWTASVANDEVQTITAAYYYKTDGTWAAFGDILDGTESGGATLAITGYIDVNMPTDWVRTRMGGIALDDPIYSQMYWVKVVFTGALKTTTAGTLSIATYEDIYKIDYSNNAVFEADATAKARSAAGSNFYNTITYTTAEDTIYVGCKNGYFRGLRWIIDAGTPNAQAAVTTCKYYNGAWVDLLTAHNFADGTIAPAGTALGQSGDMTWDQISDGLPTTINSTEAYWVALTWNASLTANITFQAVMLINPDVQFEVFYRGAEDVTFTEGSDTNWPSQITNDLSFKPVNTTVLIGGTFDSTNELIYDGMNLACAIQNVKVHYERGSTAAQMCMDGSGVNYPKQPGYSAKPAGTITMVLRGDTPMWWLSHEHLNQGTLADTVDVPRTCIAINSLIPLPIDGYATDDTYPQVELSHPYCALKEAPMGSANDEHICTVVWEIGADNTNSYRPVYARIISTDSSSYAQAS